MEPNNKQHRGMVLKFFNSLNKNGPLGTIGRICGYMQSRADRMPGCQKLFSSINGLLTAFQHYLDSKFDRKYGTDTAGVIPIKDLAIQSKNIESAIWYEPMSVKIFGQIMDALTVNFDEFTFIDFGSGKGRVLLMASNFGFKKIIGVEFALELHQIAVDNVRIYKHYFKTLTDIETICEDAAGFPIPNGPLVIFFYSPFKGKVMEQVLANISTSFTMDHRKIIFIFHGENPETIELLKAMNFQCEELETRPDWSRLRNYRSLLFMSP